MTSVPRPSDFRPEWEVIVTTPDFRRGQKAAWVDFEKDPDATPNRELLAKVSPEFAAGYVDEWETFCVPARKPVAETYPVCGRCGETAHSGLCWFDPR